MKFILRTFSVYLICLGIICGIIVATLGDFSEIIIPYILLFIATIVLFAISFYIDDPTQNMSKSEKCLYVSSGICGGYFPFFNKVTEEHYKDKGCLNYLFTAPTHNAFMMIIAIILLPIVFLYVFFLMAICFPLFKLLKI